MIALARFAIGLDDDFIVRLPLDSRLFRIKIMINFSYFSFLCGQDLHEYPWSVPKSSRCNRVFHVISEAQTGIFPTINVLNRITADFSSGF